MSELQSLLVDDIKANIPNAIVGGPFGSNLVSRDYVDIGIPVIRGSNMGQGRWVTGPFAYVSEKKAEELSANTSRPGDLVFTQRGTLGQVCLVPEGQHDRYVISQSQMKLTADASRADSLFLYYVFCSPSQQHYIRQNAIQTGVPHTNLGILRETPLELPTLPEQQRIAHILGTLDDKIELNRRMNRTLEAIARAIFKSWFIDFDPVHAKAEGREPVGMDPETAALFPDSFQDSPLGKIPKGWEVAKLSQIASVNPRSVGKEYSNDEIAYIDISSVTEGTVDEPIRYEFSEAPSRARRLVQDGDTIWSCVRPNRKAYLYIYQPPSDLVVSTGFAVLSPLAVPPNYLYYWTTTPSFIDYLTSLAHGAAYPAVRAKTFEDATVLLPPPAILTAFHEVSSPMRNLASHAGRESRSLAGSRDALLPILLSGDMQVSAGEHGDSDG